MDEAESGRLVIRIERTPRSPLHLQRLWLTNGPRSFDGGSHVR